MKLFPAKGWGFKKKKSAFSKKENGTVSLFQSQSKGSWPSWVATLQLHEEVGKEKIKLENIPRAASLSAQSVIILMVTKLGKNGRVVVSVPGLPWTTIPGGSEMPLHMDKQHRNSASMGSWHSRGTQISWFWQGPTHLAGLPCKNICVECLVMGKEFSGWT